MGLAAPTCFTRERGKVPSPLVIARTPADRELDRRRKDYPSRDKKLITRERREGYGLPAF